MSGIRFSLLTRLALALAAVGLLPLAVMAWGLIGINRRAMTDQILATHAVAANTAAARIATLVSARRRQADSLAANPSLFADPRSRSAQEMLQDLLTSDAELLAISVTDGRGVEAIRVQRKDAALELGFMLKTLQPDPVALFQGEREPLLSFRSEIGSQAVLRIVTSGAVIRDALRPKEIGQDAEIALVDADEGMLSGSATARFPAELLAAARLARTGGAGSYATGPREVLGAYAPVPETRWSVVSMQPAEIAHAVERRMRNRSLRAVALTGVLAAIIGAVTWSRVVRPIRELVAAQRRLAGSRSIRTGDEIRQLREGFAAIEKRIHDQEDLDRVFLGRYQVLQLLGEGGMGSVFRGWDPKLQRQVALKTLRVGRDVPEEQRKELVSALVQEAVTIAALNHPNVVAIFDIEDLPDAAFMAMELIDGETLHTYCRRRGGMLSWPAAAHIGVAIARALAAAHAGNIAHRDIKPANVLLDRSGAIKVSDFGIAELMSGAASSHGMVFGTPGYIAPEALCGGKVGSAADLFSLGVVLYEISTGVKPFEMETVTRTIRQTITVDPPTPRSIAPQVDAELEIVIMNLLAKKVDQRPPSAAIVAERLQAIVEKAGQPWVFIPSDGALLNDSYLSATFIPTRRVGSAA